MRIAIAIVVMIIMWATARKKGFNPFLWILATGIPGLIVLLCMPSADSGNKDDTERLQRRSRGNLVGLIFSSISIVLILGTAHMIPSPEPSPWQLLYYSYIVGVVEGLTEFIPVSSTGHLILVEELIHSSGERAATFSQRRCETTKKWRVESGYSFDDCGS